jgi:hypothetical protein
LPQEAAVSDQDHISRARKRDALRQQGILNPRPRDVTHPLFQNSEFFDSRDLLQVTYEMLREVQVENKSVSDSAAAFASRGHCVAQCPLRGRFRFWSKPRP